VKTCQHFVMDSKVHAGLDRRFDSSGRNGSLSTGSPVGPVRAIFPEGLNVQSGHHNGENNSQPEWCLCDQGD
jgi:hypothetical protein